MVLFLAALASAHDELGLDRGPVAYALAVTGSIVRNDGTYLDVGEAIEAGARFSLPMGATATVAHGGRIERWEGPGSVVVDEHAVRITLGTVSVRRRHVEDVDGAFTGALRAPAGREQVVSVLGLPMTASAWARQDGIDGGALHTLYRDSLRTRLAAQGVAEAVVDDLGLADALPGDVNEQTALVANYLDLTGATPNSVLVLEALPTDSTRAPVQRHVMGHFGDVLSGKGPHTFRVDARLDKIRTYARMAADAMRARGASAGGAAPSVFGLVVPYANTVENIVLRGAHPRDGVEVLHLLLARLGPQSTVPTLALGYSQGGAVIRDYLVKYGDSDGLDFAVSIATMGGVDGRGADGVWAGRTGAKRAHGVSTVAVVHTRDPAKGVFGRNIFALAGGLHNFDRNGKPRNQDGDLHSGYFGVRTLPGGVDPARAAGLGTWGYPVAYVRPLVDALLAGRLEMRLERRGSWEWDMRSELPGALKGDFVGWRTTPEAATGGYLD